MSKYFISVEVEATIPMADLVNAIQRGYDAGASGSFQVVQTCAPSFVVLFERDPSEDCDYVGSRWIALGCTMQQAIAYQLAEELEGLVGECANCVVEVLKSERAKCFDFGSGAIESMFNGESREAREA